VWLAILKFTDVFSPIGIGKGALPMPFAILPLTDVFNPTIGRDSDAKAIVPS
jgi:hypothetical protein